MTSPTTPRDDIAGLSERLRFHAAGEYGYRMVFNGTLLEAATQLDAFHGEISQWANEVARYKAYAEKFDEENAALQARVKELEGTTAEALARMMDAQMKIGAYRQNDAVMAAQIQKTEWMDRATRAEQERDEAYERAVQAIRGASSLDENGYIVTKDAAIKAIRRLAAGTEKGER